MIVKRLNKLKDRDAFRVHRELVEGKEFIKLKNGDYAFYNDNDWEAMWRKTEGDTPVDFKENKLYFLPHDELWY